jgi:DNA polymerase I-like protein with 3'-5' exonuclease and polymerase domains
VIFLRADLSAAEDRVVGVYSHDDELIAMARSKPWEFDKHQFVADEIGMLAAARIERQSAKKVVHGGNYGEQAMTMSDSFLRDGQVVTPEECEVFRTAYLKRFPGISNYQRLTRDMLFDKRTLVNSWGRSIQFKYERFDDNLFRRGYAWRPQADVACLLNQGGFIPLHEFIERNNYRSRINTQTHDEVLTSVTKENGEAWDIARLLRDGLETEREYEGVKLVIPVTITLENRYYANKAKGSGIEGGVEIEFKRFPEQDEFNAAFNKVWEARVC